MSAYSAAWWVIHGDHLWAMLERVHNGEEPRQVYLTEYDNVRHEQPVNTNEQLGGDAT